MATKNTGVKGVIEDYRLHLESQKESRRQEALAAIKQGYSLRVEQVDYTFKGMETKGIDKQYLIYVDDDQYLNYIEGNTDYIFLVMDPSNDHELLCLVLSRLAKKYDFKCVVYTSQLIEDTSVTPMLMRYKFMLPCFLRKQQHQSFDDEEMINLLDNAEQLLYQYELLQE